jgi:hypothetical protein
MPLIQQVVEIMLPLVATLVAWAIRQWVATKVKAEHRAMLCTVAESAYWVVAQIARKTPGGLDDKVAIAIKVVVDELKRPLTPAETAIVSNTIKATHEQIRPEANGVGAATVKSTR